MKHSVRILLSIVLTGFLIAIDACGGGKSQTPTPPPNVTLTITANPTTLQAGGTAQVSAMVSNDPSTKGVTWTVSCAAAPCGSVSPSATASGVSTTYTAPASAPASDLTVTISATSVANT